MKSAIFVRSIIEKLAYILGDDLSYFAASLSFYTIFSIIPMLWVVFFVLSKLEIFVDYYQVVKDFLIYNLIPTHTESVTVYLDLFMDNSKKMGVVGLFYVFLASILFYRNFQYVVNKIFYTVEKSVWHSVETYFILAVLMPVTLGGSLYLSNLIELFMIDASGFLAVFDVLSYLLVWMLFLIVFKVTPNMKINYHVALFVSLLVSLIWQLAKSAYVFYVLANQTYVSLYGSFSVVLFFLLWIYLSWFMLLHGLRLCYLLQCRINK